MMSKLARRVLMSSCFRLALVEQEIEEIPATDITKSNTMFKFKANGPELSVDTNSQGASTGGTNTPLSGVTPSSTLRRHRLSSTIGTTTTSDRPDSEATSEIFAGELPLTTTDVEPETIRGQDGSPGGSKISPKQMLRYVKTKLPWVK